MHWRSRRNYNSNLEIGKHTYRYIINKRLEAVSRIIANLGFSLVVTLIWCLKNVTQTCKFSKISSNQMTSSKTNEMLRLAIFWTLSYLNSRASRPIWALLADHRCKPVWTRWTSRLFKISNLAQKQMEPLAIPKKRDLYWCLTVKTNYWTIISQLPNSPTLLCWKSEMIGTKGRYIIFTI